MDTVRVGVIGMGKFGIGEAEIVRTLPNAELVAGARRTPDAARQLSERFGVPVYRDWREMLDRHAFDLVAIASTNETHREMTLELIERGIAVHCQKPMGITLDDARAMRQAAEDKGVYLQVGFECRYSLLYRRVKDLVDAGELGEIVQVYFNYSPGVWTLEDSAWKVKASSGGLFANKLNHYVDILRWLIGRPLLSVSCTCAPNVVPYYEFPDNAFSTYRFEGGAIAHILFNQTATALPYETPRSDEEYYRCGHRLEYTVVGRRGTVFVDIWHPSIRVIGMYQGERYAPRVARVEDYRDLPTWKLYHNVPDETADIVCRVAEGREPYIAPADAYRSTLACLAADASLEQGGRPVELAELDESSA